MNSNILTGDLVSTNGKMRSLWDSNIPPCQIIGMIDKNDLAYVIAVFDDQSFISTSKSIGWIYMKNLRKL